jgi:septation ring formation regulator EzrA
MTINLKDGNWEVLLPDNAEEKIVDGPTDDELDAIETEELIGETHELFDEIDELLYMNSWI